MSIKHTGFSERYNGVETPKKNTDVASLSIQLDIKTSNQQNYSFNVDDKLAIIHANDADKVDIQNGEPVLLLVVCDGSFDDISNRSYAAVYKVQIVTELTSPRKRKNANVSVNEGEIYIPPIDSELFSKPTESDVKSCTTSGTEFETTKANTAVFESPKTKFSFAKRGATSTSKPISKKSTRSEPGFSFAKGGDGNALHTPRGETHSKLNLSFAKGGLENNQPTPLSTQTHANIKDKTLTKKCLLIPLHHLDRSLFCQICPDAGEIILRPVADTSYDTNHCNHPFKDSRTIIQTLIASKYHGSYVRIGYSAPHTIPVKAEVLSIVFRGQIESFYVMDAVTQSSKQDNQVDEIMGAKDNITLLSQNIGRLQLKESDTIFEDSGKPAMQLEDVLHKVVGGEQRRYHVAYRITSHTRIRFECDRDNHNANEGIQHGTSAKLCAGLDTTLSRLRHALLPPVMAHNLFPSNGPLRAPKGVLLYGPSGVGKSLIAAQIANDLSSGSASAKMLVKTVQCADLLASTAIIGEAEKNLTCIFENAENQVNGSLLILDDVHLICPRRGSVGSSASGLGVDQLAGTLLALLDGMGTSREAPKNNFVVLAIATDPSLLDPALRRPGRLDSEIEMVVPDDNSRADIFRFHLERLDSSDKNQRCDVFVSNNELKALSRLAKGFTGADCKLAVKEAVRNNITRHNSKKNISPTGISVTYEDLAYGIRQTKPSAIKSVSVEVAHVPWSSIGGMDDVKLLLRESIDLPLTHPHLFEMMKVPPPKGILLYGPPGCSKTLMARAIATEGQMNFLAVKGPELLSKWLGESERTLASLFRRARLASPSVVFFDEVDAIAGKRGGGGGGDRLLSQLLTELDGVTSGVDSNKKPYRVLVVGATNRPDTLDPALTRPGRMDRMIYVGLPDMNGRKSIFAIGLRGKACHNDVDVSTASMFLAYPTNF